MRNKSHAYISKVLCKVDGRLQIKGIVQNHWDDIIIKRKNVRNIFQNQDELSKSMITREESWWKTFKSQENKSY